MSFASDKLYKDYLRRKMPTIATKVKVREIMAHLSCLTDHDRENIEAKRETYGNFDSMLLLLDCLKRRENWPEQFIAGLEACEHTTLAADVRAEYDALRGINPSSPSQTVIRAHVHPAPSATHLPTPEAAVAPPAAAAAAAAPPEPAARASPPPEVPVQPLAPQNPAAQVPVAVSPPEPVAEPPQPAQVEAAAPPSTPPPSPKAPHTQATATPPPPQREVNSHQEPVEDSESDIQDVSGGNGAIPAPVDTGNGEVSISPEVSIDSAAAPPPSGPVEQCETDTPSCPESLQTTTTTTTTAADVTPPQSPPPSQINSDVTDGSSFLTLTPMKPPVQDTTPPVDIKPAAVPQPEETTEPPVTQVVESSPQIETAAAASAPPVAAAHDDAYDDSVCLSKPGQLVSVLPQNHAGPADPEPSPPQGPYSGDSERLEFSDASVTSTLIPACSAVSSAAAAADVNAVSELPCQENGIGLSHNEPEENQYDSPCQSFDVRENVVQISEEPSILNLDGQSSAPHVQSVNGEAAKEIASPPPPLSASAADTENHHPFEPAPAAVSSELQTLQDSEEKTPPRNLTPNTKYILTAAGVGACALLIAWKFKKGI